jgi:hypothetical protein
MADAAVGSIAHILKTAFKDIYAEKEAANVEETNSSGNNLAGPENVEATDPSITQTKPRRRIDQLGLSGESKSELQGRVEGIERSIDVENSKADELVHYLREQREEALRKRGEEEEALKKRGIIVGQHIPALPSQLAVDPDQLSQYGKFSSNLLIARELVAHNHDNMLRRTGNLPISEEVEKRKTERGKWQLELESKLPGYLEQTQAQQVRASITRNRFSESLKHRDTAISGLHMAEDHEVAVTHKPLPEKMSTEDRLRNEAILKDMQHKLNYMRNPRNDPKAVSRMLTKASPSALLSSEEGSNPRPGLNRYASMRADDRTNLESAEGMGQVSVDNSNQVTAGSRKTKFEKNALGPSLGLAPLFVSDPKRIVFNGYDVGKEYKKSIHFRNVSRVSRTLRVLAPRTSQFKLGPLQYPANSKAGYVAPGMTVSAHVLFAPDSLFDFSDSLTVDTEGGSFLVPIIARRESPALSLPERIDIGSCLVGDALRTCVRIFNSGGPGKFQLMSREEFDQGLLASASGDFLRLKPFSFYPLEASIDRNEYVDVTVEFVPTKLGGQSTDIVFLSDSGHSFRSSVYAQSLETKVYISEINGTEVNPDDVSVVRDLYFPSSVANSQQIQTFSVSNDTGAPVEYEWVWIDAKAKDVKKASIDKLIEREKSFGALDGGASQFKLPDVAENSHSKLAAAVRGHGFEAAAMAPDAPLKVVAGSTIAPGSLVSLGKTGNNHLASTSLGEEFNVSEEDRRKLLNDTLLRDISGSKSQSADGLDGISLSRNCAFYNGFEVTPARGTLGTQDALTVSVSYSPPRIDQMDARLVLLMRSVTKASVRGKDQEGELKNLSEHAHGRFLRLRGWLVDMAEVPPTHAQWVSGSAAACGATPLPLTPERVKLVNLKTLLSLAINYASACFDAEGNQTTELGCILYHLRDLIRFTNAWKTGASTAIDDFEDAEESPAKDIINSMSKHFHVFEWKFKLPPSDLAQTSLVSNNISLALSQGGGKIQSVPRITTLPANWRRILSDGISDAAAMDAAYLAEPAVTQEEKLSLQKLWVHVDTALRLLGDRVCECLDDIVRHESTDFIQTLVRFNLPAFSMKVSGSGKAFGISVMPPRLIIGGVVSIGKPWKGTVLMKNPSQAIADITIDFNAMTVIQLNHSEKFIKDNHPLSNPGVSCRIMNSHLLLMPESEAVVDIDLLISTLGEYEIRIPCKLSTSMGSIDDIVIYAKTAGPAVRFETPEVDLGLLSTGCEIERTFTFTNEHDVPLRFTLTSSIDTKSQIKLGGMSEDGSVPNTGREKTRGLGLAGLSGVLSRSRSGDADNESHSGMLSSRSGTSVGSQDSFAIENPTAVVSYEPTSGLARPNESVKITMKCMGGKLPQRIRGTTDCYVTDETGRVLLPTQIMPFRGEVQTPKAILLSTNVNIGTVYENIGVPFSVTLQNLSNLPTKFKFERPGGESPLFSVQFEKGMKEGVLEGKEKKIINMILLAKKAGIISDLMACKLFGASAPIGFSIKAVVKSLSVDIIPLALKENLPPVLGMPEDVQYKGESVLPEPRGIEPIVVGLKTKLYERKIVRLALRNLSPIAARFTLAPKKFSIGDVSEVDLHNLGFTSTLSKTKAMLVPREDGENKFHSIAGKSYVGVRVQKAEDSKYLTLGQGASYAVSPNEGIIGPWGVQEVFVYARNDMPGCFDDELICDIENYRRISIPLKMSVEGCPLIIEKDTYGMTVFDDPETLESVSLLLMGNLCRNEEAPERQFRVRNSGSVPTRVRWQVRSASSKVNGPIKVEIKLGSNLKASTRLHFWDDLAKSTPFTVEPSLAVIPAYSSTIFKVKLLRTSEVNVEKGLLTGSVILDSSEDASSLSANPSAALATASQISLKSNTSNTSLLFSGAQYKINVRLEAKVMAPAIRIDENFISVQDEITEASASATIRMRTHVPMLFENGGKSFDTCSKDLLICNPLTANLVFAVSVEGPFSLHSAHELSKGGNSTGADARTARGNRVVTFDPSVSEVSAKSPGGAAGGASTSPQSDTRGASEVVDGTSVSQIGASILTTGKAFNLLPGVRLL